MRSGKLFTFLTGAMIGAGLTWLYTTEKGEEVRSKIKEVLSSGCGITDEEKTEMEVGDNE